MDAEDYVDLLYRRLLQRPSDPDGLRHFAERLRSGERLEGIIDAIVGSEEYRQKELPAPPLLDFRSLQTRPLVVVDLGAQALADEAHVYAPLMEAMDWRCFGFEPQKDRLQDRLDRESAAQLSMIDAFIGDGEEHHFSLNSDSGSSSLLSLNPEFNRSFDDLHRIRTISRELVQTRKLDDITPTFDVIDFLKLDVQGFELKALQGAQQTLRRTNVVHCEVFFGPMYKQSPFFSDIEIFLRSHGFEFVDFSHLNRYEYIDVQRRTGQLERLIWGDAVFFRQVEPSPQNFSDLLAQAAIASLVYRKDGLAQKLLESAFGPNSSPIR